MRPRRRGSHARITIRRRRDGGWHAAYNVFDRTGRLMFRDDGTASVHWAEFVLCAQRQVAALRVLDEHDYLTSKDWPQLVDEAEI